MQKQKIKTLLAKVMLFAMSLTMFASPQQTLAAEEESGYHVEVINNVSIDDINIEIAEYELNAAGEEVPFRQNQIVVPGQFVSKIVRITNVARPAWIRIKPTFEYEEGMKGVDEDMFVFANNDWVKRGEYYYCTHWLPTNGTEDFIKEVFVPTYWDSTYQDKKFEITFTADAVQSENFTPDFDSEDPWFGTLIEQCIHTHYDEPQEMQIATNFSVEFRGGAQGLVRLGEDWFKGWEKLMPGDIRENYAIIGNNYSEPVKIYFYTENIVDGPDELLENIKLTIRDGDKILFQGTMEKELDRILLGEYAYGETSRMSWTLEVPPELTNRFALTATKTKWVFEAELPTKTKPSAPTGDDMLIWISGGAAALLFVALIALIAAKKKKNDKEDAKTESAKAQAKE